MSDVHYEVFARKSAGGPWALSGAMEDRDGAEELASQLLKSGQAAGTKVIRETFDPATGEFKSSTVSRKGDFEDVRKPGAPAPQPAARAIERKPSEARDPRQPRAVVRQKESWLTRLKGNLFGN